MPVTSEKFNAVGGLSVGIPPIDIISDTGNITATLATIGNVNAGQGVFGNITVSGNITGNIIGNVVGNITGNIRVPGADTQILYNIGGNIAANANLTFNPTTATLTVGNLCVQETLCANTLSGNGANITNVAAITANTVINAVQGNITQLPNLFSFQVSNTANFSNIATVIIPGGDDGDVILTNGSGNLSWSKGARGIHHGTSNITIPSSGGDIVFGTVSASNAMIVGSNGNITINTELWVSGNVRADVFDGNGARLFDVQAPNIVGSFGNLDAQDTITANTLHANHKVMIGNSVWGSDYTTTNSLIPTVVFDKTTTAATITLVGTDTVTNQRDMTVWTVVNDNGTLDSQEVSNIGTSLATKTLAASGSNITVTVTPLAANLTSWTTVFTTL